MSVGRFIEVTDQWHDPTFDAVAAPNETSPPPTASTVTDVDLLGADTISTTFWPPNTSLI